MGNSPVNIFLAPMWDLFNCNNLICVALHAHYSSHKKKKFKSENKPLTREVRLKRKYFSEKIDHVVDDKELS